MSLTMYLRCGPAKVRSMKQRDFRSRPWKIPELMKLVKMICALMVMAGLSSVFGADAAKGEKGTDSGKKADEKSTSKEVAVIKTTEGDMVIEFFPDVAPKTVENFKTLARKGFYDGTCFHRVIKGFMIQGGDPLTKDPSKEDHWGEGGPGYQIKAEFNDNSHVRGVVSMARSQDPDTSGSQFFICHGNPTSLDHKYTAFGKLIKGDEVLEK